MVKDSIQTPRLLRYKKYYDLVSSVPQKLKSARAKAVTMLIFSLMALSFFGVFAINPTLTTITELQKKVQDAELVDRKLTAKITNLSLLQKAYPSIEGDIPTVYDALPQTARAANLLGKIKALAENQNISLTGIQIQKVKLTSDTESSGAVEPFSITMSGTGTYEDISTFLRNLYTFDRIVTVDELTITKPVTSGESRELSFSIKGFSYILFEN